MVEWAVHINAATEEEVYTNSDNRNINPYRTNVENRVSS